ncbi:MAG: hypothetical protein ACREXX_18000, partial [Gammaproteobacteria bacterium]
MTATTKIRFRDLVDREEKAREQLRFEKERLEQRKRRTTDEERELQRINALLKRLKDAPTLELVDPLYVAARDYFNANGGLIGKMVLNHKDGRLRAQGVGDTLTASGTNDIDFPDVVKISLVLGLLAIDATQPPRLIYVKD